MADLERLTPFMRPGGTLTPGNTSAMHDGAAIVVVVSDKVWQELGRPKALRTRRQRGARGLAGK